MEKIAQHTLHKRRLFFEGRSKRIYDTSENEIAILEFKSEFSPDQNEKTQHRISKPQLSASISHHIFSYLHSFRIPNHYIEPFGKHELVIKKLDMIPIPVVVRNIAAGSLCARYNIPEGRELEFPIVELVYKNELLDHPMLNESHILAFGMSTPDEVRTMIRIATKTNAVLRSFVERRRLRLVDIWLEFGRLDDQVVLGDTVTPDSFRLFDMDTNEIYDSTRFRLGVGNQRKQYHLLHQRLTT